MKRVLKISAMAGLLALGIQAQAEALPSLRLIGCQNNICTSTAFSAPAASGIVTFPTVTIGDYTLSGQGGWLETSIFSRSSTTTVDVNRTGSASASPLVVWVEVLGYTQPGGSPLIMDTTHSATGLPFPATSFASISYQAWFSNTNAGTNYVGPVGSPAGVAATPPQIPVPSVSNGLVACTPDLTTGSCNVGGNSLSVTGGTPFSLVTRTIFNIAVGDTHFYTSGSQVFVTNVPEPASMLLLGTGLAGLAAAARRRRRNQVS